MVPRTAGSLGPGLAAQGLDPARLVLVQDRARYRDPVGDGRRSAHIGCGSVVGEVGTLPDVASRRLQLAAERSGITAFALRRWRNSEQAARERNLPNAAMTRWRVQALPSQPIPIANSSHTSSPHKRGSKGGRYSLCSTGPPLSRG